eukprot:2282248-Rhodomonas_salina.1
MFSQGYGLSCCGQTTPAPGLGPRCQRRSTNCDSVSSGAVNGPVRTCTTAAAAAVLAVSQQ